MEYRDCWLLISRVSGSSGFECNFVLATTTRTKNSISLMADRNVKQESASSKLTLVVGLTAKALHSRLHKSDLFYPCHDRLVDVRTGEPLQDGPENADFKSNLLLQEVLQEGYGHEFVLMYPRVRELRVSKAHGNS